MERILREKKAIYTRHRIEKMSKNIISVEQDSSFAKINHKFDFLLKEELWA